MTALPAWTDPLYEAAEMRAADAWAIEEQGVPEADLMERAGLGLARVTASVAGAGPVRIVVGKGNNGGDGLVAARLLREDGYEVDVLDGTEPFERERLAGSGVVVDALLGTGFEGSPREPVASAIWAINQQDAPVVACDVPSGVNASTGEVEGEAVSALVTATFHGSKVGLHVNPGKEHAGRVEVVEIGIPRGAPGASAGRPDLGARARPVSAADAERLEVRVGRRGGCGRLGGADGCTDNGRTIGCARRRGLRAGGGPGLGATGGGPASARADEPRAAGRRRLPHPSRGGRRGGDGRARRAPWCSAPESAVPRALRSSPAAWPGPWRHRCWWMPTA